MVFVDKLSTEIFPKAVTEGKFGENKVKLLEFKPDKNCTGVDQHCSAAYFGDVTLETDSGDTCVQSVFIKARVGGTDPEKEELAATCLALTNEFLFYTEILPLLQKCDPRGTIIEMFPKFFFGSIASTGEDPSNEYLVFENVQKRGFELCSSRTFIDRDHLELTLRKIAQFHSVSLVCKKVYSEEFKALALRIRDLHFTIRRLGNGDGFFQENAKRGILSLRFDPEYQDKLRDISTIIDDTDLSMTKIVTPEEPMAVICHGDLQRCNIFYRFDTKSGAPCELIFFDLATARYCSPIIDLSLFLFMNVSPEARSVGWRDLLQIYHSALTTFNPDLDPAMVPSFAALEQDFKRRGLYGYVWSSILLPVMFHNKPVPQEAREWWKMSPTDHIKLRLETGGEKGTFHLKENVKFMIDEYFDFNYIMNLPLRLQECSNEDISFPHSSV